MSDGVDEHGDTLMESIEDNQVQRELAGAEVDMEIVESSDCDELEAERAAVLGYWAGIFPEAASATAPSKSGKEGPPFKRIKLTLSNDEHRGCVPASPVLAEVHSSPIAPTRQDVATFAPRTPPRSSTTNRRQFASAPSTPTTRSRVVVSAPASARIPTCYRIPSPTRVLPLVGSSPPHATTDESMCSLTPESNAIFPPEEDDEDPLVAAGHEDDGYPQAQVEDETWLPNNPLGSLLNGNSNPQHASRQEGRLKSRVPTRATSFARSLSRSSSVDPLSLFTPVKSRSKIPREARASASTPIRSTQRAPSSLPSSPLTPASSPVWQQHQPHSSPASRPSALSPQHEDAAADATEAARIQVEEAAHAGGRYVLRTRLARQLKPYHYDSIQYKRQMRENPDAIVRVVSPLRAHRLHGSHASDGEQIVGGEEGESQYVDEGGPDEVDEEWRVSRRKEKSRSVSVHEEVGQEAQGRSASIGARAPRSNPRREQWVPAALRETFSSSSSEDDLVPSLLPPKKKTKNAPDGAPKPRKPKPFPMGKTDFQPTSPEQRRAFPVETRHASPSAPSRGVIELNSDEDDDRPIPTFRRTKSTNFPSFRSPEKLSFPLRPWPTASPPSFPFPLLSPQHDAPAFPDYNDHQVDDYDNFDIYNDFGSPAPLPPTSTDVAPSDSSDGAENRPPSPASSSDADLVPQPKRLQRRPTSPIELSDSPQSQSGSGSGSGSDSEQVHMSAKARRQLKALRRMMPGVLIARHLKEAQRPRPMQRSRSASASESGTDGERSEKEERPLLPGQSRVQVGGGHRADVEIKGDAESSDTEVPGGEGGGSSSSGSSSSSDSDSDSDMDVVYVRGPARARSYSARPGSEGVQGENEDETVEAEVGTWLSERPPARTKSSRSGEAKEGDLIDRMLSRTRVARGKPQRARGHRSTGKHRAHRLKGRKVHVITGGARGGAERQMLLQFARHAGEKDEEAGEQRRPARSHGHRVQVDDAAQNAEKQRRKQKKNAAGLYTFSAGGGHIASGRVHKQPTTIDAEEVVVRDARVPLLHDHANEDVPPPIRPLKHRPKPARNVNPTLEDYWDHPVDTGDHRPERLHNKSNAEGQGSALLRRMTIDCGIPLLPSGISMGANTFLARGWLYELLALFVPAADIPFPNACSMFDFNLQAYMSAQDISVCLESICDRLHDELLQRSVDNVDECLRWQILLHAFSQHFSWLLSKTGEDDYVALYASAAKHMHRLNMIVDEPMELLAEDEEPNLLALEIRWFMVELACRVECHRLRRDNQVDDATVVSHVQRLICLLWKHGFQNLTEPFLDEDNAGLVEPSMLQRTAELWITLIHLLNSWSSSMPQSEGQTADAAFWTVYVQTIRTEGLLQLFESELETSETIWRSVFSLCALSQFSVHGLTTSSPRLAASWTVVTMALEKVRLVADPIGMQLTNRSLNKRDKYIRLIVSRCLMLSHTWRWSLDDAFAMFNRLLEIFKSRRFANLSDEPSDFPSWLRHNNLQLLYESKRSDTAFTLFLKLLVQGVKDAQKDGEEGRPLVIPPKLKKLLAICIPVGSVPFTKANPPTGQELSMLYNRFSAVAVAIHLDHTMGNVKSRLAHARRYVNFRDTDNETRRACIRGLMHLTILLRYLSLPLDDILDWLGEMTHVLVDEYKELEVNSSKTPAVGQRGRIVICIQMLLGCVRRIIETPLMEPDKASAQYPDPALLQGPWVTRVLSNQTNLTSVTTTGIEIRRLVQAFLDARSVVIPRSPRARLPTVADESQESQEEYGECDLNFDDPELLAALGEEQQSARVQEDKARDKTVAEIIDAHISPAIYRLVCKHFQVYDRSQQGTLEGHSLEDTDRWIDCWVGCASVVVQNAKRDWNTYLTMGGQSWDRIMDPSWRRHVGLRFMFMLLQLDQPAYSTYKSRFIDVLMEALVTAKVSFEHDFASLLLSIDGLRHPLFHGLPCELPEGTTDYKLSKKNFLDNRVTILEKIFANLAQSLHNEVAGDARLMGQNQTNIGSVVTMLNAMQDIYEQIEPSSDDQGKYRMFCQQVVNLLAQHDILRTNSRLVALLEWAAAHLS